MRRNLVPPIIRGFGVIFLLGWLAGPARAADTAGPGAGALSVLVLGSGGPGATGRAGAGYLILLDGRPRILVDAGPGTFVRAGEAGVDLGPVDIVLLTHLHIDHAGELAGLIKARVVAEHRDLEFTIFGPSGSAGGHGDARFPSTTQFVDLLFGAHGAFSYVRDFAGHLTLHAHDVPPSPGPQVLLKERGLRISASTGHHGDAPSVIYRIDYRGRSVTFSGDIDAAGHAALERLAQGSDALVFDAVVLDPPGSPAVLYTLHTAPREIGLIAGRAGVKKLLLSHLNPAVDQARDAVRRSIAQSYAGPIEFARDGLRYEP
ncbi:MAG: MBL fold metallo-hydrolase [Steroidobacteraceae bacterium]